MQFAGIVIGLPNCIATTASILAPLIGGILINQDTQASRNFLKERVFFLYISLSFALGSSLGRG